MNYLFANNKFDNVQDGYTHLKDAIYTANLMESELYKTELKSDCKEIVKHLQQIGGDENKIYQILKTLK